MNTEHLDSKLRFSILTPVHNGAEFVEELIVSVLRQDYEEFDHVIIDDGSTDSEATVGILQRYPHLRWKSQENIGQFATFNELIKNATGDVLSIINADDLYPDTGVLSAVAKHFQKSPDIEVVIGRTGRLARKAGKWYVFFPDLPYHLAKRLIRWNVGLQHCAIFVRRSLIEKNTLYFDPSYKMKGDWDWIIRLLAVAHHVVYTDEVFAYWRLHDQQSSKVCQSGESEARRLCSIHGTSYRFHRFASGIINRWGTLCAASAMAAQLGPRIAFHAMVRHGRHFLGLQTEIHQ